MSIHWPGRAFGLVVAGAVAIGMPTWVGCSGGEKEPISSANSKFEVESGEAGDGEKDSAETGSPAGSGGKVGAPDDSVAASNPESSGGASPANGGGRNTTPPADPAANLGPDAASQKVATLGDTQVPDGDKVELTAFLGKLDQHLDDLQNGRVQIATNDEMRREALKLFQLKEDASDKLLAIEELTDDELNSAIESKLVSLSMLERFGEQGVSERMTAFAAKLLGDPTTASKGHLLQLGLDMDSLASGALEDASSLETHFAAILADKDRLGMSEFMALRQAAQVLFQIGQPELGRKSLEQLRDAFASSEDEQIAEAAKGIGDDLVLIDYKLLLQSFVAEGEGDSEALIAAAKAYIAQAPAEQSLGELASDAVNLEYSGNVSVAESVYDLIRTEFASSDNAALAKAAQATLEGSQKRLGLIGKPYSVTGVGVDGEPFAWEDYKDKVVLVDFWATWCGPCIAEFPHMKAAYAKYRDKGFEIVGINLDNSESDADSFLATRPLPWRSIRSADPAEAGFMHPNAVAAGVEAIPFLVLVGKDGNVAALHVRGSQLEEKLAELLGPVEDPAAPPAEGDTESGESNATEPKDDKSNASESETGDATSDDSSTDNAPTENAPADAAGDVKDESGDGSPPALTPPANDDASVLRAAATFVSFVAEGANAADDEAAKEEKDAGKDTSDGDSADEDQPETNPYLAPAGLADDELVDFLFDMQEKPKSIQYRPGFAAAVIDAADRVIAESQSEKFRTIAAESKFEILHRDASLGDESADGALRKMVDELKDDPRERIAKQVRLFQLEYRLIDAEETPVDEIEPLLADAREFLKAEALTDKHLRMASSIVHAINQVKDDDTREKLFAEFGAIFSASKDKQLARYGKKLMKPVAGPAMEELVGKPLELRGVTALGQPFDWASYRGKVVLVDFWATWCGPCRREMPHVRELYNRLKDRGLDVIGVNLDQDEDALAKFLEENDMPWTNLVGETSQELAQQYGVRGIPTMMLIDRDGKIVATSHQVASLVDKAEKLLAGDAAANAGPANREESATPSK